MEHKHTGQWVVVTLIVSMICSLCTALLLIRTAKPQLVTIDLPALVRGDMAKQDLGELDDQQLEHQVAKIIAQRKAQIEQYAAQKKLIVLPKALVLSKGIDITPILQKLGVPQ